MTERIRVYDICTTLHPNDGLKVISHVFQKALKAEEEGEWSSLCIVNDHESYWSIQGYRWETDEEFKKRQESLAQAEELKKELNKNKSIKEYKEYQRLKKKYEKILKNEGMNDE